jgi:predicted nucleic acid-binding protein
MIVVSDTTPINYLVLIDEIELLPTLFGKIIIPQSVLIELQRPEAPQIVRQWLADNPNRLEIKTAFSIDSTINLGAGECEAISLAKELNADLILIDDRKARLAAIERGLTVAGTLNILELASIKNLLELSEVFDKLKNTNFRVSQILLDEALERERQRKTQFDF